MGQVHEATTASEIPIEMRVWNESHTKKKKKLNISDDKLVFEQFEQTIWRPNPSLGFPSLNSLSNKTFWHNMGVNYNERGIYSSDLLHKTHPMENYHRRIINNRHHILPNSVK